MISARYLINALQTGAYDGTLSRLYALDGTQASLERARKRAVRVTEQFTKQFDRSADCALFSGPGRTEIGGNHTDHQHGRALCGSVDMDMLACAAPNGENMIRILSEGYPAVNIALDDLAANQEDINTSAALARGVAEKIQDLGYTPQGFDAYVTSTVLAGSGVSSSAAYETLVSNIFNHFCCGDKLDPVTIAKIGHYAENVHFGKLSGLLDQLASSVGGCAAIDFKDPTAPVVERVDYDFNRSGHALCIVDTGSSHSDKHLTEDYSNVTREMCSVAAHFGKNVLREVPEDAFRAELPSLRVRCGDRAILRAIHFYDDDRRAVQEAQALKDGDFNRFLSLVNESGLSSALYLQNIWSTSAPQQQAVSLSLALGRELLEGAGAIRVHGGGFAGTIQAFVPNEKLEHFKSGMEALLGPGKCHVLHIRPQGGCVVVG